MNSLERIIGRSDTAEETEAHLGRSENCIPVYHRDELLLQGCSSRWRVNKDLGYSSIRWRYLRIAAIWAVLSLSQVCCGVTK